MAFVINFPVIDPVLIELGPLTIRWYALAYIFGILIGWHLIRKMAQEPPILAEPEVIDDFLTWVAIGIIVGGRLGYVIFYNYSYYIENLENIFAIWKGGMSFHGGFLGVCIAAILYCLKHKLNIWRFGDLICVVAPIGLFFGRIANFINGELFGRPTLMPWGVVFPRGGNLPRHPSQIYEAIFEGLLLFFLLWILSRREFVIKRPGLLIGLFCLLYGAARAAIEVFREPDIQIGYLGFNTLTMGQLLSIPMVLSGIWLIRRALTAGK